MRRTLTIAALALVLDAPAGAAPSIDCTKAQTPSEKAICGVRDLEWLDRQVAKLYGSAMRRQTETARSALVKGQRDFLARREACMVDAAQGSTPGTNPRPCLEKAYTTRINELGDMIGIFEPFAEYTPPEHYWGMLRIARHEFTAGLYLSIATGPTAHECMLDVDEALKGGKGVIRGQGAEYFKGCRVDLIPEGEDIRIESQGCEMACGARARIDGLYTRAP